jgi:hypothetical protein
VSVSDIFSGLHNFLNGYALQVAMPTTIDVEFSHLGDKEIAGQSAGVLVLERDGNGGSRYAYRALERRLPLLAARSELVINHALTDAASLNECLIASRSALPGVGPVSHAFIAEKGPNLPIEVRVLIEPTRPELGTLKLTLDPHPLFASWFKRTHGGSGTLSHHDLADLLLDNAETLEDANVANVFIAIRASKSVEHAEDLGDATASTVVTRSVKGKEGAPLRIPRRIVANVPVFVGAWEPGAEPKVRAEFSVRAVPTDDGAPMFRVQWGNLGDVYAKGVLDVVKALRAQLASTLVLRGVPNVEHYDAPSAAKL